jgi:hypothetical protein
MGSLMCLLYDASNNLTQVIVDFDLENGSFSFVDRDDLLTTFSPSKNRQELIDLFICFGALYGLSVVKEPTPLTFASIVDKLSSKSDSQESNLPDLLGLQPNNIMDLSMLKIIYSIAPVLNNQCELDCLNSSVNMSYEGNNFKQVMGLCFNSEIYY